MGLRMGEGLRMGKGEVKGGKKGGDYGWEKGKGLRLGKGGRVDGGKGFFYILHSCFHSSITYKTFTGHDYICK